MKKLIENQLFLFLSLILTLSIAACDSSDLPDLKGRYVGERTRLGDASVQIIAEVPSVKKKDNKYSFKFALVKTLASGVSEPIEVKFTRDKQVFVMAESISDLFPSGVWLKANDPCANGNASGYKIQLCWAGKRIDLVVTNETSGSTILSVILKRDSGLPPPPQALENPDHKYTLDEIMGRSKFYAYSVEQEAERVFQAKNDIKVSLGNLLPKFNLRDLFPVVIGTGGLGLIEIVGDLLPFLFPSNWFKWAESKALYQAEKRSFASLRGNEMNYTQGLYYVIHRDQILRERVQDHITRMREIEAMIKKRELYGQMPSGSYERFSLLVLNVEQDLSQLDLLLSEELSALSHAVALPPSSGVGELSPPEVPDFSKISPLDPKTVFPIAQERSFETATVHYLIEASKSAKDERVFGFLDPNSSSTIGFGYAASIRVGKSRTKELEIRKTETLSLIEKSSVQTAAQWNQSLDAYKLAEKGLATSTKRLNLLHQRLRLGDDSISEETFIQELLEANEFVLKFKAAQATAVSQFLIAKSKVDRLLLEDFYRDLEAAIPTEAE